jgi:hypothetical protein
MAEKPSTQSIIEILSLMGGGTVMLTTQNFVAAAMIGAMGSLGLYKQWSTANVSRKKELSKEALRHAVATGKISAQDAARLMGE